MTKITSAACAGVWFLEPVEHGFLIFKWSDELQKPLLVQKLDAPHGVMAKFWEGKIVMASRYGHSTVIELLTCHEEKFMPKDHTVLEHFNFKDLASCATAIFVLSTHSEYKLVHERIVRSV